MDRYYSYTISVMDNTDPDKALNQIADNGELYHYAIFAITPETIKDEHFIRWRIWCKRK